MQDSLNIKFNAGNIRMEEPTFTTMSYSLSYFYTFLKKNKKMC